MKQLIILCLCILQTTLMLSQVNSTITIDSSSSSKVLSVGETVKFEDRSITFIRVLQDSRCPKSVTCVRAGEADIILEVRDDSGLYKAVTVRIEAIGPVTEKNNLVMETADFKYYAFALEPYPITADPIDIEKYRLDLVLIAK
jgi:hypothetical protein